MTKIWTQRVKSLMGVSTLQCQGGHVRLRIFPFTRRLLLSIGLGQNLGQGPLEGVQQLSQSGWGTKAMVKDILHKKTLNNVPISINRQPPYTTSRSKMSHKNIDFTFSSSDQKNIDFTLSSCDHALKQTVFLRQIGLNGRLFYLLC